MKELWEILKQAGFSTATLAQAFVAAAAFTLFALFSTGLDFASALQMLVGAFVLALVVIAGFKAIYAWRGRSQGAGEDGPE